MRAADDPSEHQHLGEWFLPQDPHRRVAGTFTYRPGQGGSLVLIGSWAGVHPYSGQYDEIILGETTTGWHVTLWRCWPVAQPEIIGHRGPNVIVFAPERAFFGHHFATESDLSFNSIEVRLSSLGAWIRLGGFRRDLGEGNQEIIVFESPEPLQVPTVGGPSLSIRFRRGPLPLGTAHEARLVQHTVFRAENANPWSIDAWLEYVEQLQMLLIFATDRPVRIETLHGESELAKFHAGEGTFPKPVEVLAPQVVVEDEPTPHFFEMLFSRVDLGPRIAEVIARWLALWPDLGPILSQYCGTVYNRRMFLPQRFLALCQGLESYHLRRMGSASPSNRMHQELTWKARLESLLSRHQDAVSNFTLSVRHHLVDDIVATRNYLTHLDPKKEARALKDEALFWACERLSLLMQACLMSELGFTDDQIRELLLRRRSTQLAYNLF